MDFIEVPIMEIKINARRRKTDQQHVEKLAESIKEIGLLTPIALTEEKILVSGAHRLAACKRLGWEKITAVILKKSGLETELAEIDENLIRNELDALERCECLARRKEIYEQLHPETKQGGDRKSEIKRQNLAFDPPSFVVDTATKTGCAKSTIREDIQIARAITPEVKNILHDTPISNRKTDLLELAKMAPEQQKKIADVVQSMPVKSLSEAKREIVRNDMKKENEAIAKREVKPSISKYDVLVIDPPWPIKKIERECRPNQSEELDYPTMSIEDIKSMKIPAKPDAHVFLWTTHKFLPDAIEIMKTWNCKYICTFVWHKEGGFQPFNLPQYNCEFVLYGHIGSPKFMETKNFFTCFSAPRTGHSEKPELFYETIRRVTGGNRIDMFNRRQIAGFDTWGKEAV